MLSVYLKNDGPATTAPTQASPENCSAQPTNSRVFAPSHGTSKIPNRDKSPKSSGCGCCRMSPVLREIQIRPDTPDFRRILRRISECEDWVAEQGGFETSVSRE